MVFEVGQSDKANPMESQDFSVNTVELQNGRLDPGFSRNDSASKVLPGLIIESVNAVCHALSGNREMANADKAMGAIEKGDFRALQKQLQDLARGDRENQALNMPLLLAEIKKQSGLDVSFCNAEMTVTAKLTDTQTGRKDLISVSVLADGTTSVATHEKGGVEQKDFPSVEEATKMIMKSATSGDAAKGIIGQATMGEAVKGIIAETLKGNVAKGLIKKLIAEK